MPEFSVILVNPKYDGNIGSVARVMKNFGFNKLVLVKPPELGREARAKAMHARGIIENAERAESLKKLKDKFDFLVATSAISATDKNPWRTPILPENLETSLDKRGSVGLVFGREDRGLTNEEIECCDLLVTIPANPEYPTLNLAQAAGIVLYEISRMEMRHRRKGKKYKPLDLVEKKIMLEKFDAVVDKTHSGGFERKLLKKTFRQLVSRAFVSGREAHGLIGLFRKAAERIE